jgi:DNA-binding NarL/FixJ family response regulator
VGAALHGFHWSEAHDAKLARLIHEGLNLTVIARRFGCSQRTISLKARNLAERRAAQRQAATHADQAHT